MNDCAMVAEKIMRDYLEKAMDAFQIQGPRPTWQEVYLGYASVARTIRDLLDPQSTQAQESLARDYAALRDGPGLSPGEHKHVYIYPAGDYRHEAVCKHCGITRSTADRQYVTTDNAGGPKIMKEF